MKKMLFYSMLNDINKLMIEKILPIMLRRFLNDNFALKNCRALEIVNLASDKKIRVSSF